MPEANVCDYKDLHIESTVDSGDDVFIYVRTKHLKKSNAACFYTPIVLKLLIVAQM